MRLRPTQQSLSRGRPGASAQTCPARGDGSRVWLVSPRARGWGRCLVRDALGTGSRVPSGDLGAFPSTGPGPNRGPLLSIVFIAF